MPPLLQTTFERTLQGYAQGFRVDHIATYGLETCSPTEEIEFVFQRLPDFDQIPVEKDDRIIGIIVRNDTDTFSGKVSDHMRILDDSLLVSSEEPLSEFLPLMAHPPYFRLVIQGAKIEGIVTRSDMLKLPVRLYAFALVINLELLMKEIIQEKLPEDSAWKPFLTEKRLEKLRNEHEHYKSLNLDLPLIESTCFCDKYVIIKKLLDLPKTFISDLGHIENRLRNLVAHGVTFAGNEDKLLKFLNLIAKTQYWIQALSQYLN